MTRAETGEDAGGKTADRDGSAGETAVASYIIAREAVEQREERDDRRDR
jgi:hypothetical protein